MGKRAFDRVIVIMLENQFRGYVMRNAFMRKLAKQGTLLLNYFGVFHPSSENYIASLAGSICGRIRRPYFHSLLPAAPPVTPPPPLTQPSLPDLMEKAGLDWKAYMSGYFPVTWPPTTQMIMTSENPKVVDGPSTVKHSILDYPPYINTHNPFVRFKSICDNPDQWARIDNAWGFLGDVTHGTLPQFCWFSPNLWEDGHWLSGTYSEGEGGTPPPCFPSIAAFKRAPVLVDQTATWLEQFFRVLRFPGPNSLIPKGTLVVVTFDEADFDHDEFETVPKFNSSFDGPNQVYTVLLGDMVTPGKRVEEGYCHYSLLKTIEKNFGLDDLGANDQCSNAWEFLWGKEYRWGKPAETTVTLATNITAAAAIGKMVCLAEASSGVSVRWATLSKLTQWSEPQLIENAPDKSLGLVLVASETKLNLFCRTSDGISLLTGNKKQGWSAATPIVNGDVLDMAATTFFDYGDKVEKIMLVYRTNAELFSVILVNGKPQPAIAVGHQAFGKLALASLGASIFLIFKSADHENHGAYMNVVTYNTADFNVVSDAGGSNTTQDAWSPTAFPVVHYGVGPFYPSHGLALSSADLTRSDTLPSLAELLVNKVDPRLASEQEHDFRTAEDSVRNVDASLRPYPYGEPLACATLEGVIHLAHPLPGSPNVVTETFSISGILTPKNPVNYKSTSDNISNGFGTLAEAGWSRQAQIKGIRVDESSGSMVMCRCRDRLIVLFQTAPDQCLQVCSGEYAEINR